MPEVIQADTTLVAQGKARLLDPAHELMCWNTDNPDELVSRCVG
jgi:hypothetical protein